MPSAIDPSKPIVGTPTTASVRDNFAAAKAEIEALQANVANLLNSLTKRAIITADFPPGTNQPAPTANVWQTRTLNTVINDGGFLLSLANNAFTIPPGTYALRAELQAQETDRTAVRLRNLTADLTLDESINHILQDSAGVGDTVNLDSLITLPAETTLEYQQIFAVRHATLGWGVASSFTAQERYARVTIQRITV